MVGKSTGGDEVVLAEGAFQVDGSVDARVAVLCSINCIIPGYCV